MCRSRLVKSWITITSARFDSSLQASWRRKTKPCSRRWPCLGRGWSGVGKESHWGRTGSLMGESVVRAGEEPREEVDLETWKNVSAVELPIGSGVWGRWRYAEGSRNKIRKGLASMRARGLEGVELVMAVLVSGRYVSFRASAAELLPVVKAVVWHSTPSQPSKRHHGCTSLEGCPLVRSQAGSGRLDSNKPLSSPSSCCSSFICRLFSLLTAFVSSHDVLLLSLNWPTVCTPGKEHFPLPHWNSICLLSEHVPAARSSWLHGRCLSSHVMEGRGDGLLL